MFRKFLSWALAFVFTLTTTIDLAANTRVPSPVNWKMEESRAGPVILAASGKSPTLLRPTFNRVARPVAQQPPAGKRVSVSRNIGRPVVAKSMNVGRIRGVSLPRSVQRVSVSPTVGKKFTQSVRPAIKALARKPISQTQKIANLQKIRKQGTELQRPNIKNASLRVDNGYKDKSRNAIEHSLKTHGYGNAGANKSEFNANVTSTRLRVLTRVGLRRGSVSTRADGSSVVTYKFSKPVGKLQNGQTTDKIRIIIRDNIVQSVHPGE